MADGVAITAGSGTTVATDDAGAAGHVQVVKLAVSTDGSATALTANNTDGLLVNLGSNNDVTVSGVSTAANQTTIIGHLDGVEGLLTTIDADTGGIATSAATIAGAVSGTEMQVDVLTMPTVTVDSELPAAAALADNTANPTVPGVAAFPHVFDGTTWDRAPGTSADGLLVNLGANNDVTVSGVSTAANQTTIIGHLDGVEGLLTTIDADTSALAGAVSGTEVQVDIVAALPAGTNNIGDVDVLTLPNVTLAAGTNTNEVVGDVAEDAAIAGNPVRVGGRASAARPTAMSADGDIVSPWFDLAGALHTVPGAATTATLSSVSSSASSVSLLSSSTSRKGVIIHNSSTQILYVKYGATATASTGGYTYKIPADATWEMPTPIYTGALDGIWASANGAASITQLT